MEPLGAALQAAGEAGELLLRRFGRPERVRLKAARDIVTASDRASERAIRKILARACPSIPFLGEEGGGPSAFQALEAVWVVDPLDGTVNFSHGNPVFAVSIALLSRGRPVLAVVHDPTRRETFRAMRGKGAWLERRRLSVSSRRSLPSSLLATGFSCQRGGALRKSLEIFARFQLAAGAVRRPGSAAIDLAYVSAGRFDGFWEMGLKAWDVAAGWLLVEEAGGAVTDYEGSPFRLGGEILASNGRLHRPMMEVLRRGREAL